jgi:hypothetical protein
MSSTVLAFVLASQAFGSLNINYVPRTRMWDLADLDVCEIVSPEAPPSAVEREARALGERIHQRFELQRLRVLSGPNAGQTLVAVSTTRTVPDPDALSINANGRYLLIGRGLRDGQVIYDRHRLFEAIGQPFLSQVTAASNKELAVYYLCPTHRSDIDPAPDNPTRSLKALAACIAGSSDQEIRFQTALWSRVLLAPSLAGSDLVEGKQAGEWLRTHVAPSWQSMLPSLSAPSRTRLAGILASWGVAGMEEITLTSLPAWLRASGADPFTDSDFEILTKADLGQDVEPDALVRTLLEIDNVNVQRILLSSSHKAPSNALQRQMLDLACTNIRKDYSADILNAFSRWHKDPSRQTRFHYVSGQGTVVDREAELLAHWRGVLGGS